MEKFETRKKPIENNAPPKSERESRNEAETKENAPSLAEVFMRNRKDKIIRKIFKHYRGDRKKTLAHIFECDEHEVVFSAREAGDETVVLAGDARMMPGYGESGETIRLPRYITGNFIIFGFNDEAHITFPEYVGGTLSMRTVRDAKKIEAVLRNITRIQELILLPEECKSALKENIDSTIPKEKRKKIRWVKGERGARVEWSNLLRRHLFN